MTRSRRALILGSILATTFTAIPAEAGFFGRLFGWEPIKRQVKRLRALRKPAETPIPEGIHALVKIDDPERIEAIPPHTNSGGFHGTQKSPARVKRQGGFRAKGKDLRLDRHVDPMQNAQSAFRGTTPYILSPDGNAGAALWAGRGGYVFEIAHVPTWDVNLALRFSRLLPNGRHVGNPLMGEHEFAILGDVSLARIKRWGLVEQSSSGKPIVRTWQQNPDFVEQP